MLFNMNSYTACKLHNNYQQFWEPPGPPPLPPSQMNPYYVYYLHPWILKIQTNLPISANGVLSSAIRLWPLPFLHENILCKQRFQIPSTVIIMSWLHATVNIGQDATHAGLICLVTSLNTISRYCRVSSHAAGSCMHDQQDKWLPILIVTNHFW